MKKGPAAMEFLMTYGWAILVVLAAVAALAYFGVLSPSRFLPESCTFPAGFSCIGKAAISDTNNRFDCAIKNNQGGSVNITGVTDDANDDCAAPAITACVGVGCTPAALPSGGLTVLNDNLVVTRIACTSVANGRFSGNPIINYRSLDSGLDLTAAGNVRGSAN